MKLRLDLQYHAIRLVMNDRLFFAPVKNPHRILDCGTGTGTVFSSLQIYCSADVRVVGSGIWAMDAGKVQ